jgi:hypothetical protein
MDCMKPVVEEELHFLDIKEDLVPLRLRIQGAESSKSPSKTIVPAC